MVVGVGSTLSLDGPKLGWLPLNRGFPAQIPEALPLSPGHQQTENYTAIWKESSLRSGVQGSGFCPRGLWEAVQGRVFITQTQSTEPWGREAGVVRLGRECGTQSLGSPTPCSEVCQGVWKPLSVNSKHKASALNFARGGSETDTLTNLSLTYHSFLANDPGTLPNGTDGVPSLQHFASPQTPVSQRFPHDFSHYCCLRFNHRKF